MGESNLVQKVYLHTSVAESIENYIKRNDLERGDKLPSEREFAEILSVGRSSFREALRRLETINMVEVVNGKGVYVKNSENSIENVYMLIANEKANLLQIFQVRSALEGLAVELAVENATDEEIKEMEELLDEIENMVDKGFNPNEKDEKFHKLIYYASKNNILINILESMSEVYKNIWYTPLGDYSVLIDSISLHRPLLEAIKKRDKKRALDKFNELIEFDMEVINEYKKSEE